MKRTLISLIFGVGLVVLMSACGGGGNKSAGLINPTPVNPTLTNTFDPNNNTFLNGCQGCQFQNPATSCTSGIFTSNGTCITNPNVANFGQNYQTQYSNAVNACQLPQYAHLCYQQYGGGSGYTFSNYIDPSVLGYGQGYGYGNSYYPYY